MRLLTTFTIWIGLLTTSQAMEKPSFHTKGTPNGRCWWTPQLIPRSKEVSAALSIISTMGRGNLQMMDALHEPTLLFLLGLEKPVEMTGRNLLLLKNAPQLATKVERDSFSLHG